MMSVTKFNKAMGANLCSGENFELLISHFLLRQVFKDVHRLVIDEDEGAVVEAAAQVDR